MVAAVVMLAAQPTLAVGAHHGTNTGPVSSLCPYGTGSGDNGCSTTDPDGSYQNSNLINTAQQDGQNSLLPLHAVVANGIVPFNIACVDYACGPNKNLTPRDPRAINDSVCQYQTVGTYLACTGSGLVNYTLDNVDLCGTKIGQSPVGIYVGGGGVTAGSTFTVSNVYFCAISGTGTPFGFTGNYNFIYKNNQCDYSNATSASGFCIRNDGDISGSTFTILYSVFTNQGVGRIAGGFTNMAFIAKYFLVQGLNDLATANHGELMLRNCTGARKNCTSYEYYEGMVVVWNPPPTSGLNNATVFPGDGSSDGVVLTSFTMINPVIVTNKNVSNQTVINQALFNARLSSMGAVTFQGAWVSAAGADGCSISGVKSGGTTVTADASAGVVNITGLSSSFNNFPIEKGWQFWRGGVLWGTITSMGTSTGNTGTVNVDNSATVPSDSSWTLVPGFSSLVANDNYNLNDPGHTGVAAPMNISGPQFVAATCNT